MKPRIAIPLPLSTDPEYVARALPQYELAVHTAGGQSVQIELNKPEHEIDESVQSCDGVLLPGSKIDIDPARYGAARHNKTAPSDPKRDAVDRLLLEHAYSARKPVLGICYGLQSLNVYRGGTLIQHVPDVTPPSSHVNHAAGRSVAVAHDADIVPSSQLAQIVGRGEVPQNPLNIHVNSSHHQAAENPGKGLVIVSRCPDDGIIEALEGEDPGHFVLAVQWHPERSIDSDEHSRSIFRAFLEAARHRR